MDQSIADIRKEYNALSLNKKDMKPNPVDQFLEWFKMAINAQIMEPNAMTLSTVEEGKAKSRVVLLKGVDEQQFIFYTNYRSEKAQQIEKNPFVALNFFWPELERQVRIEGKVEKVSHATSDAYFKSRPRASQIGAWVSPQSSSIDGREVLDKLQKEMEKRFENKEVQRPEQWGGYAIKPTLIEFWQGRPSRLHDRIRYSLKENNTWKIERLAP